MDFIEVTDRWGFNKITLRQRQNSRDFVDDIFKCMFMKKFFYYNFTGICSQGSNWQYSSMGSGNSLAPTRRKAINWTNDG